MSSLMVLMTVWWQPGHCDMLGRSKSRPPCVLVRMLGLGGWLVVVVLSGVWEVGAEDDKVEVEVVVVVWLRVARAYCSGRLVKA